MLEQLNALHRALRTAVCPVHAARSALVILALTAACSLAVLIAPSAAPAAQLLIPQPFAPSSGFANPIGVAINQSTGEVYVGDYGSGAVYAFLASGAEDPIRPKLTTEDGTTPYPFANPFGVAVDNSLGADKGDIYVSDPSTHTVEQFDPQGAATAQAPITEADVPEAGTAQPGGFPNVLNNGGFLPTGIAVASDGSLFVADVSNNVIDVFEPDGTFVSQFGAGIFGSPNMIATGPSGELYVATNSAGTIEFDPTTGQCLNSCTAIDPSGYYGVATDPGGDVLVDDGGRIAEFSPTFELKRTFGFPTQSPPFGGLAVSFDLAVNESTGDIYVSDFGAAKADVFKPVTVPDVTTGLTTNLGKASATLTGHLDPDAAHGGGEVTECEFEYGETPSYGQTAACETTPPSGLPYSAATDVHLDLSGLVPETTYHYRLVAANDNGANQGQDQTLTTDPAVTGLTTGPASNVMKTGATLTGSLTGEGEDTHYYFEYGPTSSYGQTSPASPGADAGSGIGVTPLSTDLSAGTLEAGTTYHYRVVAYNATFGTSDGQDRELTTLPAVEGVTTEPTTDVTSTSVLLHGSYSGDGQDTHYYFQWGTDTSYGHTTVGPPGVDNGSLSGKQSVSAELTGLGSHVIYHFRLVAVNSIGTTYGNDEAAEETPEPPTVDGLFSSELTATTATLNALINPQGYATEYHFEYGITPAYGASAPIPEGAITGVFADQHVAVDLSGLEVDRTYHFRVIARSKWGTTTSEDQSFNFYPPSCPNAHVRQETESNNLPDCRAYELVSPENANGVTIGTAFTPNSPTADNVYAYHTSFGEVPGAGNPPNLLFNVNTYAAKRTNTGWVSKFVGIPGNETGEAETRVASLSGERYLAYNSDPVSVFHSSGPFLYDDEGHRLEQWPANLAEVPGGSDFRGASQPSPDFRHFFFSSRNFAFTGGQTSGPGSAYEYNPVTGTTQVISKTASGEPIPLEPGDLSETNEHISFPRSYEQEMEIGERNAGPAQWYPSVSTNGSHVLMSVFATPQNRFHNRHPLEHLYMRVDGAITYEISSPGHDVRYFGMTADGSKVFFTSEEQLTGEDHDHSIDLYVWSEKGEEEGQPLTLLSKGDNAGNEGEPGNTDSCNASWVSNCNVLPVVGSTVSDNSIAAENGDIYFYSSEQLDGNLGVVGQQNLYVYREGRAQFVAAFVPATECNTEEGVCSNGPVGRIQVSPNDSHVGILTSSRLTSYPNAGHPEMYAYTPATGRITCASCRPNGEPPSSDIAASTSGLFMTNDGRLFFYTDEPLVLQDTNGLHDVYEFTEDRPQLITRGTGSAPDHVRINGGTGIRTRSASFIGVTADGVNAYFSTFDTFVDQDTNGNFLKIYDARSGGGFAQPNLPQPCAAADECHGAGSSAPPAAQITSGAGLGQGGNYTPIPSPTGCRARHLARKHGKCAKRRKGSAKRHRPRSSRSGGHGHV